VPDLYDDLPPAERNVVVFFDPSDDLADRDRREDLELDRPHLDRLAGAAARLAGAEADAWERDVPDLAMRAFEARRLLFADRIVHWAVPWLDTVGRCHPAHRQAAHAGRDALLAIGDELRVDPDLGGAEGRRPPGEDGFGPVDQAAPEERRLLSLWSGAVLMRATLRSLRGDATLPDRALDPAWLAPGPFRTDLADLYDIASARWSAMAEAHAGTARLWLDLAARARATSGELD
jgi:hypothetical protein